MCEHKYSAVEAALVPSFMRLHPVANFCNRRMFLLSTLPIELVEQKPVIILVNPEPNGLEQLTLVFEQFLKQILALVIALVVAATVVSSAGRRSFSRDPFFGPPGDPSSLQMRKGTRLQPKRSVRPLLLAPTRAVQVG